MNGCLIIASSQPALVFEGVTRDHGVVTLSLFQHWIDALHSSQGFCAKVYRFLLRFYGEQASRIAFPPLPVRTASIHLDPDVRAHSPRTPHQIRSQLIRITEAVRSSRVRDSW